MCLRARVRMIYFIDVLYNNVEFDRRANIKRLIVMICQIAQLYAYSHGARCRAVIYAKALCNADRRQ